MSWGSGSDSRGVQIAQVGPKLIPESVQVGSKSVQVGSKSVQVGSKSVQVHPRFFQDGPKGEPRWRQDDPRLCQDGPSDRPPARPIARPSDRPTEFIYTNSRSTASAAPYYYICICIFMSASHSRRAAVGKRLQAMEKIGQMTRQVGRQAFGSSAKVCLHDEVSAVIPAMLMPKSCQDRPKIHPKLTQDGSRAPQSVQ